MPTKATIERLNRLAGETTANSSGRDQGGGLPLPWLFGSVLEELIDHGHRTTEDLIGPVAKSLKKPERVQFLYPADGYAGLVRDTLAQLKDRKLAEPDEAGSWRATAKTLDNLGKPLTIIPQRGQQKRLTTMIWSKAERNERGSADLEQMELKSLYHDLFANRQFEVRVEGRKNLAKYRIHPAAFEIPPQSEPEFAALVADIRKNGIRVPVTVTKGSDPLVVDGRHRVVIAAALGLELPPPTFYEGEDPVGEVVSLNFIRRDLRRMTMPQRALTVMNLFLKDAEKEAAERMLAGEATLPQNCGRVKRGKTAVQIAAERSYNLCSARTLETMKIVRKTIKTRRAIVRGEIKSVKEAVASAEKELGLESVKTQPQKVGAFTALGQARNKTQTALKEILTDGLGAKERADYLERVVELRGLLEEIETTIRSETPGTELNSSAAD